MEVRYCDVEMVQIGNRLRTLNPDKVAALAESMDAIGLQQPVTVWRPIDGEVEVVAGAHRVKAACDLGWVWIDCIWADKMTDLDRQLSEIYENLMRAAQCAPALCETALRRAHIAPERR